MRSFGKKSKIKRRLTNSTNTAPATPFSTGGGGYYFETRVAVSYLVSLLRQQSGRGLPNAVVHQVGLQQRNKGHLVDDIVVVGKRGSDRCTLSLQVRHYIVFSDNPKFREVIASAWNEFIRAGFRKDKDRIGLAISEVCNNKTVKIHVNNVLEWAKSSVDAKSFYQKINKYKAKKKALKIFELALARASKTRPLQTNVFTFLRHFYVLPFDIESNEGTHYKLCHDGLLEAVVDRDPRDATVLFNTLYRMVTDYACEGGEITYEDLVSRVKAETNIAVPMLHIKRPSILELLKRQVNNKIMAEKNSRKYIPDIFVETSDVKDKARLFCHPGLFLKQLENDIRRLEHLGLNQRLDKAGAPRFSLGLPAKRVSTGRFDTLSNDAQTLRKALCSVSGVLSGMTHGRISVLRSSVPAEKYEVFTQTQGYIENDADFLDYFTIPDFLKRIDIAKARVFAIVSRAGQGKTNFVCDLTEKFLQPRGIPCALLTGKDFRNFDIGKFNESVSYIISSSATENVDNVLEVIENEASGLNVPGVIIFDALNEHDNINAFATALERFIEKCMVYPHLRVIVTCRSEYYDVRFKNLEKSSFGQYMVVEREIHNNMDERHKDRLVRGYFRFYKIVCSSVTKDVWRKLSEDTFLLRLFCETHGDPNARKFIPIPPVRNLRKDTLFQKYVSRKVEEVADRTMPEVIAGRRHPYVELLRKTAEWMITKAQFANVPTNIYDLDELNILTQLIDEDIFLRKDLCNMSSVLTEQDEVVNFTFDEFRDYLLADYLFSITNKDKQFFEQLVSQLTQPNCTVCEGVSQYLFCLSRRREYGTTIGIIQSQPWYDQVFGKYVFDLDDNEIIQDDTDRIWRLCLNEKGFAPSIMVSLLVRYDTDSYRKLNIITLLEIMDKMTDEQFIHAINKSFGKGEYGIDLSYYPISKLVEHLRPLLLSTGHEWCEKYTSLARLLLYLWDVINTDYEYPARELYEEFSLVHPDLAHDLIDKHVQQHSKGHRGDNLSHPEYSVEGG